METPSPLIVTLTTEQLRALIRQELAQAAVNQADEPLLTAQQLAEKLRVPLSWVYEQSRLGKLPTHRVGRYLRFRLVEVLEHLKTQSQPQ